MKLILATIIVILAIFWLVFIWWLMGAMPTSEEKKSDPKRTIGSIERMDNCRKDCYWYNPGFNLGE